MASKPEYSDPAFGTLMKAATYPLWIAGTLNLATGEVRNGGATLALAVALFICGAIVRNR
jgi:hypothetical protein